MFIGIILSRILFMICMVFILGYVFGNFSGSRVLSTITKVAAILILVTFIIANIAFFRSGNKWRCGNFNHSERFENLQGQKDSTKVH